MSLFGWRYTLSISIKDMETDGNTYNSSDPYNVRQDRPLSPADPHLCTAASVTQATRRVSVVG